MSKYEKRPSPPFSAQDFPNQIKIGNDGLEYVSKADKNKVFRWYKIKYMEECKTAEDFFMQYPEYYLNKKFYKFDSKEFEKKIKIVTKELEKKKIYLIKIGWEGVFDFIDYAWMDAREIIQKKYFKDIKIKTGYEIMHYANFIFYTDYRLFWAKHDGDLYMQWNLDKNGKKEAFEIFKKYFKNKFIEPKNSSKAIIIKLPKL